VLNISLLQGNFVKVIPGTPEISVTVQASDMPFETKRLDPIRDSLIQTVTKLLAPYFNPPNVACDKSYNAKWYFTCSCQDMSGLATIYFGPSTQEIKVRGVKVDSYIDLNGQFEYDYENDTIAAGAFNLIVLNIENLLGDLRRMAQ